MNSANWSQPAGAEVSAICFSSLEKEIISGSSKGVVAQWDIPSQRRKSHWLTVCLPPVSRRVMPPEGTFGSNIISGSLPRRRLQQSSIHQRVSRHDGQGLGHKTENLHEHDQSTCRSSQRTTSHARWQMDGNWRPRRLDQGDY